MKTVKTFIKLLLVAAALVLTVICLASCGSESTVDDDASTASEQAVSLSDYSMQGGEQITADDTQITDKPDKSTSATKYTEQQTQTQAQTQTQTQTLQTVSVTITEGKTLTQIFEILEDNGVSTFDGLMNMAQNYDYSYYPLIGALKSDSNRCFKLEGYLFPDTYEFYVGEKPQDAIGRFLRNGKVKITDEMKNRASSLGYSMDEIITVASIIQREGSKPSEVKNVAAVIYNRLGAGQKLQMDSTITYIEKNVKPYIDGDINRYNSFYNTYKCSALPSGPICNPGMTAINAALYPSDVPYLYFCHDANANYYYAETYEQHLLNLKTAGLS